MSKVKQAAFVHLAKETLYMPSTNPQVPYPHTQSLSVHLKNTSKKAMTISKDRLCDTAPARSVPSGRALSYCLVVWISNETDAMAAHISGICDPISHVQAMWGKRAA